MFLDHNFSEYNNGDEDLFFAISKPSFLLNKTDFHCALVKKYGKCVVKGSSYGLCGSVFIVKRDNIFDINNGLLLDTTLVKPFEAHMFSINPTTLSVEINNNAKDLADINNRNVCISGESLVYIKEHYAIFLQQNKIIDKPDKPVKPIANIRNNILVADANLKKKNRPTKHKLFFNEQQALLKSLLDILGISGTNNIFYFEDIINDNQKTKQIMDLESDVKKYFTCGKWSYYTKIVTEPIISFIKSILKATNTKTNSVSIRNLKTGLVDKRGLLFI